MLKNVLDDSSRKFLDLRQTFLCLYNSVTSGQRI